MSGNFEYIDIILLAMIAGFIFLRLKNILGRKTGHQGKSNFGKFGEANDSIHLDHEKNKINSSDNFDPNAKNFFLNELLYKSKLFRISLILCIILYFFFQ